MVRKVANLCYFAVLLVFAILAELSPLGVWSGFKPTFITQYYEVAMKSLALIQLIVATVLVRCTLKSFKKKKVFDNERLMFLHIVLLFAYLTTFAT